MSATRKVCRMRSRCQLLWLVLLAVIGCGSQSSPPPPAVEGVPLAEHDALQDRFDKLLAELRARPTAKQLEDATNRIAELESELRDLQAAKLANESEPAAAPSEPQEPAPQPTRATAKLQAERKAAIATLQAEKVIQKIATPGDTPRVYVLPRFFSLTFDRKQAFVGLCFAYQFATPMGGEAEPGQMMFIYDATTNKQVGVMDGAGLQLD